MEHDPGVTAILALEFEAEHEFFVQLEQRDDPPDPGLPERENLVPGRIAAARPGHDGQESAADGVDAVKDGSHRHVVLITKDSRSQPATR